MILYDMIEYPHAANI